MEENSWESISTSFTPVSKGKLARATKPRSKKKKLPEAGSVQVSTEGDLDDECGDEVISDEDFRGLMDIPLPEDMQNKLIEEAQNMFTQPGHDHAPHDT
ncbi:hypothetical protein CRG98_020053 [Punica granatum]|uniref:Uncharacterized protein n=1 Tax=Punica granatum TaxID=22663 RepID=A0A2I0JT94_PUNGR|nr:hypothetical protein CRG98_020053 [Punica granatum]